MSLTVRIEVRFEDDPTFLAGKYSLKVSQDTPEAINAALVDKPTIELNQCTLSVVRYDPVRQCIVVGEHVLGLEGKLLTA